jgi:hypothetical protein
LTFQPGYFAAKSELIFSAQPVGAEPLISHTVSVPPDDGGAAGVLLPAHFGVTDELVAVLPLPLPLPELPPELLLLLFPQPAATSATVAAQTVNRVTRFTVAVLPCPVQVLTGLV